MLKALRYLNYDILTIGDNIFYEDSSLFNRYSNYFNDKLISSNTNVNLKPVRSFPIKEGLISVYSYLSPKVFSFIAKPDWLEKMFPWEQKTLNVNDRTMSYVDEGEGDPAARRQLRAPVVSQWIDRRAFAL